MRGNCWKRISRVSVIIESPSTFDDCSGGSRHSCRKPRQHEKSAFLVHFRLRDALHHRKCAQWFDFQSLRLYICPSEPKLHSFDCGRTCSLSCGALTGREEKQVSSHSDPWF